MILHVVFHDEERDAAENQRNAHHVGVEEMLYESVEHHADDAGGKKAHRKLHEHVGAAREPAPVEACHGQDGAQLDRHLENLVRIGLGQVEELRRQDQVAGGRYGQKFG